MHKTEKVAKIMLSNEVFLMNINFLHAGKIKPFEFVKQIASDYKRKQLLFLITR